MKYLNSIELSGELFEMNKLNDDQEFEKLIEKSFLSRNTIYHTNIIFSLVDFMCATICTTSNNRFYVLYRYMLLYLYEN